MTLAGRICLITGASRGIGRGCAKALADQGATVYITGRRVETLKTTAKEIGGKVVPIVCDHSDDAQVENLFKTISADNSGRLDMVVNNCYAAVTTLLGKETGAVNKFWTQEPQLWDKVNNVGLRANYVASVYAARLMVPRGSGLIVNMSSPGGLTYLFNTAYGVGKAAQDRMSQDFNMELKGTGVHALAIWPGAVKTELINENILDVPVTDDPDHIKARKAFANGQSPEWVGKTVAALLNDPNLKEKAGRVIWCHDIADEFGLTEIDGSTVISVRSIKFNMMMANLNNPLVDYIPSWIKLPNWLFKFALLMRGNKF